MNGGSGGPGLCKLGQGPESSEKESFSGLTEALSPTPLHPTRWVLQFLFCSSAEINRILEESRGSTLGEVLTPNHPSRLPLEDQSPNFGGALQRHWPSPAGLPPAVVQMGKLRLRRGRALPKVTSPVAGLGPDLRSGFSPSFPGV